MGDLVPHLIVLLQSGLNLVEDGRGAVARCRLQFGLTTLLSYEEAGDIKVGHFYSLPVGAWYIGTELLVRQFDDLLDGGVGVRTDDLTDERGLVDLLH